MTQDCLVSDVDRIGELAELLNGIEAKLQPLIRELRTSGLLINYYSTGAIGHFTPWVWSEPGASKNILGTKFAYDRQALTDILGFEPVKFCSAATVEAMAAEAFWEGMSIAQRTGKDTTKVVGLAMTAVVDPGHPHNGDDRVFVCVHAHQDVCVYTRTFPKLSINASDDDRYTLRQMQGVVCDLVALNVLFLFAGIEPILPDTFVLQYESARYLDQLYVRSEESLTNSWVTWNGREPEGVTAPDPQTDPSALVKLCKGRVALFPGSFNPLHYGHIDQARMFEQMTGLRVIFTMSQVHPDKSFLDPSSIHSRARQFRSFAPVMVDTAPLYLDKARNCPGIPILLGADAALKLLEPTYYGGYDGLLKALEEIEQLETIFYVAGRKDKHSERFLTLGDLPIPPRFRDLFREVMLRRDVSSTQLRG